MELSDVAVLQVLLEGMPLPNERNSLLAYAAHERATIAQLEALARLPERSYETIDEVAEELVRVQPKSEDEVPHEPSEESGDPPGGDAYVEQQPKSGAVRA